MRNDRFILGAMLVGFLGLYTALVFGFFSAESESRQFYLFLIGLPMVVLLTFFPRAALIGLGVIIYGVRWLYDTLALLPREVTWLGDVFIVILVIRTLFAVPLKRERLHAIEIYILCLIGFAALSVLLNRIGMVTLVAGFRIAFRYVLLFLAAYHLDLSARWVKRFITFLFVIGLAQTPIIWLQYSRYDWRDLDKLCGTFGHGGTATLAYYLLVLVIILAARMIEDGRIRGSYLAAILWISIAPFFGEAKFFFLFLPLALAFMLRTEMLRRPVMSVALLATTGLLMVGVDYVVLRSGHWYAGRNPLQYIQTLPELYEHDMQVAETGRYERIFHFTNGIRLAAESPRMFLIGSGPGAITESFLTDARTASQIYYSTWGLASHSTISIVWLLIEYGYVGTMLWMVLLWLIYRRGKFLRSSADHDHRVLGRVLEAMTFTYMGWLFYSTAWQFDSIGYLFWGLAGMLFRLSRNEELTQLETQRVLKRSALTPPPFTPPPLPAPQPQG